MRPAVRHQAARLRQQQHQLEWRARDCGAASRQGQPDAAHPAQGAHGAGEVRSRFQDEPRVARGHVQRCGELRAHRTAVAAQTVEIMGQWFLPMGVDLRIRRLPLFFRNSEKHEFTWKTI